VAEKQQLAEVSGVMWAKEVGDDILPGAKELQNPQNHCIM